MAELNLQPQLANEKIYDGDGGSYYSWSTSKSPLLGEAQVGAGRLVLQPRGFVIPHYSDSNKIGYVLEGCCTVGMVSPNTSEEKVLKINKGDALPVPLGAFSWWFNGGDTQFAILFLGETTKAHISGSFTYFFLTGTLGVLQGFSTEFISRAYNINDKESEKLVKSQTAALILKLDEGVIMPPPCKDNNSTEKIVTNIDNASPDITVKNGGLFTTLTAAKFALLRQVGLSASLVKLDANAMLAPMYAADSSVQLIYVVSGRGRIQIVGINGENVLDTKVKAGHLLIVPKFFAAAKIADGEGMKCFSVITSPEPVFEQLVGNKSVWNALSLRVLQASLNVTQEFAEIFKAKIRKSTILIPPQN